MTQELTMTREEKALIYFKDLRARKFKDYSSVFDTAPKDSVVYEAVSAEIEIYDTTIKALEQESVLDKIIARIEQTRDKDKIAEYPYNRCIRIIEEYKK